jgi:hypothetical protein
MVLVLVFLFLQLALRELVAKSWRPLPPARADFPKARGKRLLLREPFRGGGGSCRSGGAG